MSTASWDNEPPAHLPRRALAAPAGPEPLTDLQLLAAAVLKGDAAAAYALADAVVERAQAEGHVPYADLVARVLDLERRCPWTWEGRRVRVRRHRHPGSSVSSADCRDGTVARILGSKIPGRYIMSVAYDDGTTSEEWCVSDDVQLLG